MKASLLTMLVVASAQIVSAGTCTKVFANGFVDIELDGYQHAGNTGSCVYRTNCPVGGPCTFVSMSPSGCAKSCTWNP